jgi:hypothetical protein
MRSGGGRAGMERYMQPMNSREDMHHMRMEHSPPDRDAYYPHK